jgi:Stress responsive A/B Barrel Domain
MSAALPSGVLRHLVLLSYLPSVDATAIAGIDAAFRALPAQIALIRSFECGTDASPEGLGQGYTHAYVLGFADAAARDAYLVHPAHQAFVARVKPLLDRALVFDYLADTVPPSAA